MIKNYVTIIRIFMNGLENVIRKVICT